MSNKSLVINFYERKNSEIYYISKVTLKRLIYNLNSKILTV